VIVGGGVGGLTSAALLAHEGLDVVVLERAAAVGGKMRRLSIGGRGIDAGPTVFTMRWVFEEIFATLGEDLGAHLQLVPVERLARHAFPDGSVVDLYADIERSVEAIGDFAGAEEASGYRRFCAYAQRIHATVEAPFLRSPRPGMLDMMGATARIGPAAMLAIDAHRTLWRALGDFFRDARLRQLFGRYATYCGSSPFLAPATLNVIAHVERDGVYLVEGGMYRVAEALAAVAVRAGARIRTSTTAAEVVAPRGRVTGVRLADGEFLRADHVVVNGDAEGLARGLLGEQAARAASIPKARSLSAVTWAMTAATRGFPLVRHNVFFSPAYEAEFAELFERRVVPREPTVYVCAQDRDGEGGLSAPGGASSAGGERLLVLINAPANGDAPEAAGGANMESGAQRREGEVRRWERQAFESMRRMGLEIDSIAEPPVVTTPRDFERLFPGTGGALYGPASHGMMSSLTRGTSRTRVTGLYLAGGSVHPGAGVPMVAQSGRLAARSVLEDLGSTGRSSRAATPGGISMR
jgi:1-hydroxycarotenoid 3,4-desaturase